MFYGRGAGGAPTASRGARRPRRGRAATGSRAAAARASRRTPTCRCAPIGEAVTRYYVNLDVADRPGVLADGGAGVRRQRGQHPDGAPGRSRRRGRAWSSSPTRATDAALAATVERLRVHRRRARRRRRHAGRGGGRSMSTAAGAHQWRGVIEEYRDRLPVDRRDARSSPCARAARRSSPRGVPVRAHRLRGVPQGRGREPDRLVQGPRHDDGDLQGGRGRAPRRCICASTGNTSASAAAYAVTGRA